MHGLAGQEGMKMAGRLGVWGGLAGRGVATVCSGRSERRGGSNLGNRISTAQRATAGCHSDKQKDKIDVGRSESNCFSSTRIGYVGYAFNQNSIFTTNYPNFVR